MPDKLRVTADGQIFINGELRMVGAPVTQIGERYSSGLEGTVMRLEAGDVTGLDADIHKKILEAAGFFRDQDGVWRKPSASGSSGTN